ncbi:MAG: shikimate dehydrogenase [Phycisphaerae bacterium]|nr:shikimate dehydrogenase [Phycisphaerae bacterium]
MPPLGEQVRAAQAAGADLVELRVDRIGDVAGVEALLKGPRLLPLILTVRSGEEGGGRKEEGPLFSRDEAERVALIERLGLLRPGYIDVEYATWQRSANVRQKIERVCETGESRAAEAGGSTAASAARRAKNLLILSHHDFSGTPDDLDSLFDRLSQTSAEVIKAVFTARDATDACRVLAQLRRRGGARKLIALAMGEAGLPTRILARKCGAYLTFATLRSGDESAPGQPTIPELRDLYRWERIGPDTRVYGVVGWPVSHSLGPQIHNAALAAADSDGVYVRLPVCPGYADFAAFMDCVTQEAALDIVGLSVTLPHKEHALCWLDQRGHHVSPSARRCGAVNTLTRRRDGSWMGENTDAGGALAALQAAWRGGEIPWRDLEVAILGAGGVARAVATALREQDCEVTIYNRTAERAETLARELRCAWKPWEERDQYTARILINCTALGLWPAVDETPLPAEALRPETLVFDTIYRPARTRLLRAAQERGCQVVSGSEMFIRQAAAQFESWQGKAAPIAVMRQACFLNEFVT